MSRDHSCDLKYRRRAEDNEKVLNWQNLFDWVELDKVTCQEEQDISMRVWVNIVG